MRRVLYALLTLPLAAVAALRRKDSRTWAFGAWFGKRYSDSPRYVYEYVREHLPEIRAVWLSRDRRIVEAVRSIGGEAYRADSLSGFLIASRASLTIVNCGNDDVSPAAAVGSKKLQLWHGTPLKRIMFDDHIHFDSPGRRLARAAVGVLLPHYRQNWDIVSAPSEAMQSRFANAFGLPISRVPITGSPRADVILREPKVSVRVLDALRQRYPKSRLAGYLPTHRGEGLGSTNYFGSFDWDYVHGRLSALNAVLLVKLHFYHQDALGDFARRAGAEDSRVHLLTEAELSDVNHLLAHLDVLITDYSSAYCDFLVTRRPIIFYLYDEEAYQLSERRLYEHPREVGVGPVARDWHEVMGSMKNMLDGPDEYVAARERAARRYNGFADQENIRRTIEVALKLSGLAEGRDGDRR